ncbi:sensor histidine kinase [Collimonas silvisoli]|uniref:sensor histidine kinase n=1 Tax=Collimonas silvisoli TaxID=2825884 RepID=UPI001B8D9AF2|nr:HAMP domain-containing sensor histidine kinase [Collimonas silvisoli]
MDKFWNSAAFRLSLICGGLVIASVILLSTAFYFGTVGVLARGADDKITTIAKRLTQYAESGGAAQVAKKIEQALSDGVDSDTEIYLLANAEGKSVAGNIAMLDVVAPLDQVTDREVVRNGRPSLGRILLRRLPDGSLLAVGRDMSDLNQINTLIWRAIGIGGLLALMLSVAGTVFFRSRIERKIWAIRHAALDIASGNLSRRIPVSGESDEFARLSHDLNRMLDRIEHLMDGVRHVSNTIAHNLRTPLGRIRGHLDEALRAKSGGGRLVAAGSFAIEEIDGLIALLDKLLQVAEAESGMRRQTFEAVALSEVITNLAELYDAAAEEMGVTLVTKIEGNPTIRGDKQLLASALANLLDNALKYAGRPAAIGMHVAQRGNSVTLLLHDNGPGIPEQERSNVLQRFYRLDHNQQGNGIGLSIVAAIINLHGGTLALEDAAPGLSVRMVFPSAGSAT